MSMFKMVMNLEYDKLRLYCLNAIKKHMPESSWRKVSESTDFDAGAWAIHQEVSAQARASQGEAVDIYAQCLVSVLRERMRQERGNGDFNYYAHMIVYITPVDIYRAVILALPFPTSQGYGIIGVK